MQKTRAKLGLKYAKKGSKKEGTRTAR